MSFACDDYLQVDTIVVIVHTVASLHLSITGRGHRRTGSYGNTPFNPADLVAAVGGEVEMPHSITAPGKLDLAGDRGAHMLVNSGSPARSVSWSPGAPGHVTSPTSTTGRGYCRLYHV